MPGQRGVGAVSRGPHVYTPGSLERGSRGTWLEMPSAHSLGKAHLREQEQHLCSYGKCSAGPSVAWGQRRARQASQTCKHYSRFPSSFTQQLKRLLGLSFRCFCFGRLMQSTSYQVAVKRSSHFLLHFWWTVPILLCYQRFTLQTNSKIPTQTSFSHKWDSMACSFL